MIVVYAVLAASVALVFWAIFETAVDLRAVWRLRRCRWQVWRILHYRWSLVWWSRCWRVSLVKHGRLPISTIIGSCPPLTPLDLFRIRWIHPDRTEWRDRDLLHDVWFGVWLEKYRHLIFGYVDGGWG